LSDASFVATPLQPYARPALAIVIVAGGRLERRIMMYGSRLATPSRPSTIAIVASETWLVVCGGAHSAAPRTPTTIALTATCSRRPARSPSIRSLTINSTTRPAAIAGCTTTSGASESASSCSGQPSSDRPVPSSQRPRLTRLRTRLSRRYSRCGVCLASIACSATPRLYNVEAPTAAAIPRTSLSMLPTDDRSTALAPLVGVGALALAAGYLLPGLAHLSAPLRGALGVEDRTASARGYALTFDDGPHPQGTPAVLDVLARAEVSATFFLVGEQVRRNPSLVGEIRAAGHQVGLHCDRHRNLLRLTPLQVREDLRRAQHTIEQAGGGTPTLYRPPYGVLNAAALATARRRGWRKLLWSHWGRDWDAHATPQSIAALLTDGVGEGSVLLLHDADDYSAPSSWRRTVAALPRALETLQQSGLEPVAP
jgi:peptidoglycan-N-acetylglucosamine deacetylase